MVTNVTIAKFTACELTQFRYAVTNVSTAFALMKLIIKGEAQRTEVPVTKLTDTFWRGAVGSTCGQDRVHRFVDATDGFFIEQLITLILFTTVLTGKGFIPLR